MTNMIITAIAAGLLCAQNPLGHDLKLPEGWKVRGLPSCDSVVGPSGDEIFFPYYVPTGHAADVLYEMDHMAMPLRAMIDGRLVQVTVASDGRVAVSYPPLDQ